MITENSKELNALYSVKNMDGYNYKMYVNIMCRLEAKNKKSKFAEI